jgi:hypothetical protein
VRATQSIVACSSGPFLTPQHSRLSRFPWEPRVEFPKNEHDCGEIHTKKPSNTKAWTSDENERLRELIISNASVIDIAADLGRTVKAVRARAHALRIALGRSFGSLGRLGLNSLARWGGCASSSAEIVSGLIEPLGFWLRPSQGMKNLEATNDCRYSASSFPCVSHNSD